uniref:MULE transposase domain-containing protein n=1 Tax=Lactuca sativa TaxID=4236 RepID=A0A9R1XVH5_LACSA|nr:hypothetical protein LSAT_V11C100033090 [Lactuca sativa]
MIELQYENLFEFGEAPEIGDRRCEEKSNEGWSDDEYTQRKTNFNPWYCIPSNPDCPEAILEPGPFHSLGPNDKLIVNQTYNTKKELAFDLKVEKSSKSRYQVVCMQEKCHWRLYTTLIKRTSMFEIKMFNDEHTCCSLLIKTNPGTVAYIKTNLEDHFEYCFFAIGCAIRAFRECCRKVIIMDGAHLKGKYKGTILYAVAMDGNDQILPIEYGICPKETTDSWTWFLEKLHECIGDFEGLTMFTDRAPAIVVSFKMFFQMINIDCALIRAYKTIQFEFYWGRLRNIRDDVDTYLSQIPREKWTRVYCPTMRYDYMTSNTEESMNVISNKARKLLLD